MSAQTIYALASAQGVAGIAVIRISGPKALKALDVLTRRENALAPRKTFVRALYGGDKEAMRKLDSAMVICFHAPHSFTGEDVVELHLHGGAAVVASVLQALSAIEGLRLAQPGEYTRRAFENDKIDLTEAEAIGDLIHAETQSQHELAIHQLGGAISQMYKAWAQKLSKFLAYCEAEIDFPDEDLPERLIDQIRPQVQELLTDIEHAVLGSEKGQKLRKGFAITLLGAPNAGKSSLLNALAREDIAIVTELAGTTRDVLDVRLNIGGYAVTLSDTAGLREVLEDAKGHDAIEAEGIKRALKRAEESDYKILVIDVLDRSEQIKNLIDAHADDKTFIVFNKIDLTGDNVSAMSYVDGHHVHLISTQTHEGIEGLIQNIEESLSRDFAREDHTLLTRARHKEALEDAVCSLKRALSNQGEDELLAEDLRQALRHLGRITGRVDVEELLDVIFRDFCIGK